MDQFCQFFNCIEKIKCQSASNADEKEDLSKINSLIKSNKVLYDKKPLAYKSKNFRLCKEMYNG